MLQNKYKFWIDQIHFVGDGSQKEFYDKKHMNEIKFAKDETVNELRKENFIYSFLSSVRQKMIQKRK